MMSHHCHRHKVQINRNIKIIIGIRTIAQINRNIKNQHRHAGLETVAKGPKTDQTEIISIISFDVYLVYKHKSN
jgi:hypothetical protein